MGVDTDKYNQPFLLPSWNLGITNGNKGVWFDNFICFNLVRPTKQRFKNIQVRLKLSLLRSALFFKPLETWLPGALQAKVF